MLRAENLEEAFSWVNYLSQASLPKGENTVIVTNGGGIGVMATDACEKYGINLYDNPPVLREIFKPVTPDFGSTKNPIDLTGQATSEFYTRALDAALNNDSIDTLISLYCETAVFDAENLPNMIEENVRKYAAKKKPLIFSVFGGKNIETAISKLRERSIPAFSDVYEAVSCIGALYSHYHYLAGVTDEVDDAQIDVEKIEAITKAARQDNSLFLLIDEAQAIMKLAGIPVPQSTIAANLDDAVKKSEAIGYPLVMKIVSKDIIHKSDVGGVALDLLNKGEIIDAYQAIIRNCRTQRPDAIIEGVEISQQVAPGLETIVGARRDKTFGPIIMFGSGGKYVEVLKDVAFRAWPLNRKQLMSMIEGIRSYPLLLGVRGENKKDINSVVDTIIKLGALIAKCQSISDIEVNPLVVYDDGKGAKAVDVRILLTKEVA